SRRRSCMALPTCRSAIARRRCGRGERRSGVSGVRPPSISFVEVTVRLFAMLRERAGARELTLELPDGARVRDALASLGPLAEGLPLVMAINREYADADAPLSADDELALIPPVSGGEAAVFHVRVTDEPLAVEPLVDAVRSAAAGAVVIFEGVTREVDALEYEAYVEMAEQKITAILAELQARHGLTG